MLIYNVIGIEMYFFGGLASLILFAVAAFTLPIIILSLIKIKNLNRNIMK